MQPQSQCTNQTAHLFAQLNAGVTSEKHYGSVLSFLNEWRQNLFRHVLSFTAIRCLFFFVFMARISASWPYVGLNMALEFNGIIKYPRNVLIRIPTLSLPSFVPLLILNLLV